jgi:hypothetical protein
LKIYRDAVFRVVSPTIRHPASAVLVPSLTHVNAFTRHAHVLSIRCNTTASRSGALQGGLTSMLLLEADRAKVLVGEELNKELIAKTTPT